MTLPARYLPVTRRLWVGLSGPVLDDASRRFLEDVEPGGVVLFARNLIDPEQALKLTEQIQTMSAFPVAIAIDEEGGRVTRFSPAFDSFPSHPGARALGDLYSRTDPAARRELLVEVEAAASETAEALRELGITVNFAPSIDLEDGDGRVLGLRSFGNDVESVVVLGAAVVSGLQAGGVHVCAKHFPGLGVVTEDPHFHLPKADPTCSQSRHRSIFERLLNCVSPAAMMTSHFLLAESDALVTYSESVVQGGLRGELGYEGAIVSDDLEMGALRGSEPFEWVVSRAAAAGHDVLLVCEDADLARRAASTLRQEAQSDGADDEAVARADALTHAIDRDSGAIALRFPASARDSVAGELAERCIQIKDGAPGGRSCLALSALLERSFRIASSSLARLGTLPSEFMPHATFDEALTPDAIAMIAATSIDARLLVLFLDDLQGSPAQREMLQQVQGWSRDTLIVLAGHPDDLAAVGRLHASSTVILTYGSNHVHWRALLAIFNSNQEESSHETS